MSHHHGDPFDHIAAAELPKDLPIITEAHAAKKLRSQGFTHPIALNTWETQELVRGSNRLTVTALPGKHSPRALGPLIPPVMGSLLDLSVDGRLVQRIYITGDTLLYDRLAEIPSRYPDIDLCLIHLGGTRIMGVLLTMDAEQGVEALELVAPKQAIPIHVDDYGVFKSPLSDFQRAVNKAALTTEVVYVDRGDTHQLQLRSPS